MNHEFATEGALLSQLEAELNEFREQLKQIKEAHSQGQMGLEKYKVSKQEIEARIDDLSKRIYYINKAKCRIPDKEERILQEAELLMNEYQVDLIDDKIFHMRVYLTVSVHITWVIEVNFSDPIVPLFKIPADLPQMIGNPYETLKSLKNWAGAPDQHLITILREIEEKLLNLELAKSLPELELERGRVMAQAKNLEKEQATEQAMTLYNYAADISERIGDHGIAIVCRMKAKKLEEILKEAKS